MSHLKTWGKKKREKNIAGDLILWAEPWKEKVMSHSYCGPIRIQQHWTFDSGDSRIIWVQSVKSDWFSWNIQPQTVASKGFKFPYRRHIYYVTHFPLMTMSSKCSN